MESLYQYQVFGLRTFDTGRQLATPIRRKPRLLMSDRQAPKKRRQIIAAKKATNHRCTRIGVILPKTSPWPERQVSSCAVKGKVQTNKSDQRFLGTISNWCHFHSFQLWECLKSLETFNCKPSFQGCTICPNWLYQSGTSYGLYDWW